MFLCAPVTRPQHAAVNYAIASGKYKSQIAKRLYIRIVRFKYT